MTFTSMALHATHRESILLFLQLAPRFFKFLPQCLPSKHSVFSSNEYTVCPMTLLSAQGWNFSSQTGFPCNRLSLGNIALCRMVELQVEVPAPSPPFAKQARSSVNCLPFLGKISIIFMWTILGTLPLVLPTSPRTSAARWKAGCHYT